MGEVLFGRRVARRTFTSGALPEPYVNLLDSYGSRCSAVAMTQLPVSEELWIGTKQLRKPITHSFGLVTHPFEFTARPADDIGINPLQGRT
jgi:hypothetical protein